MKLIPQEKLNKALDKALLKHRPFISEIELFKTELVKLLDHIDNTETDFWNTSFTVFYRKKSPKIAPFIVTKYCHHYNTL
jgi:hypothetical protein